jgi:DNA-binding transcriptional MerR regulator
MSIMARLHNVGAAARLVDVDEATLRRWDAAGIFPARRGPNRYRTYTDGDVEELRAIKATRRAGRKGRQPKTLIPVMHDGKRLALTEHEIKLASRRGQRLPKVTAPEGAP